jgi:hypothetical protein
MAYFDLGEDDPRRRQGAQQPAGLRENLQAICIVVGFGMLLGLYNIFLYPIIEPWWAYGSQRIYAGGKWVWDNLGLFGTEMVLIPATFVVGRQFYKLRFNRRAFYGRIEIAVGCLAAVIAANAFGGIFEQMPQAAAHRGGLIDLILAELGGLYIIARGYDSLYQALKTSEEKVAWDLRFKRKVRS